MKRLDLSMSTAAARNVNSYDLGSLSRACSVSHSSEFYLSWIVLASPGLRSLVPSRSSVYVYLVARNSPLLKALPTHDFRHPSNTSIGPA